MNKVILLDRDGVINHDSLDYIKSVDEFVPIAGSMEAIARLTRAGYRIGVATNQSGVSRGLYTEKVLQDIHAKMIHMAQLAGGDIEAVEYCIHMPDAGCFCRKPASGMLMVLAKKLGCTDLKNVFYMGDRVSDIKAAIAAGALPVMVLSPMTDRRDLLPYTQVPMFDSLAQSVDFLLKNEHVC